MLRPSHCAILAQLALVTLLHPGAALAEVSDKEPTSGLFWTVGIGAAVLCLLGTRIKPWLGAAIFVLAVLWFISLFAEIHSPDVVPHLLQEQGAGYYWQAYAAFSVVVGGFVTGYFWHRRISS